MAYHDYGYGRPTDMGVSVLQYGYGRAHVCRKLTFICDIWYMLAAMSSVVVLKGCSKQLYPKG